MMAMATKFFSPGSKVFNLWFWPVYHLKALVSKETSDEEQEMSMRIGPPLEKKYELGGWKRLPLCSI